MTHISKGTPVRQIVPTIKGEATGFRIDEESGERLILVEWRDSEGTLQQRYFKESEIEADPDASAATTVAIAAVAEETAASAASAE